MEVQGYGIRVSKMLGPLDELNLRGLKRNKGEWWARVEIAAASLQISYILSSRVYCSVREYLDVFVMVWPTPFSTILRRDPSR